MEATSVLVVLLHHPSCVCVQDVQGGGGVGGRGK